MEGQLGGEASGTPVRASFEVGCAPSASSIVVAPGHTRAVMRLPSPSAYVALNGRDLEPPWTAEYWVFREEVEGHAGYTVAASRTASVTAAGRAVRARDIQVAPAVSSCGSRVHTPRSVGGYSSPGPDGGGLPNTHPPLGGGGGGWVSPHFLDLRPSPMPTQGARKPFGNRPPVLVRDSSVPLMERALSNPDSIVDLNQLPPSSPCDGAPGLFRTRPRGSSSAPGQDVDSSSAGGGSESFIMGGGGVAGAGAGAQGEDMSRDRWEEEQ
ncbi:unnamed protein product, partial [Discosporangium mesarthrocarpum]